MKIYKLIVTLFYTGILAILQKGSFVIHLFILYETLLLINILSNQLQQKTATLGNTGVTVNGVIESFRKKRNSAEFSKLWQNIVNFANKNKISLEAPSLCKGYYLKIIINIPTKVLTYFSLKIPLITNNFNFYRIKKKKNTTKFFKKFLLDYNN